MYDRVTNTCDYLVLSTNHIQACYVKVQTLASTPMKDRDFGLVDSASISHANTAFAQQLPSGLSYIANLRDGDHAVLFYDSLVVAAEYLSAYIDQAVTRGQITYFVGLQREQYKTLFDQVGVKVTELENSGYLEHVPIEKFCLKGGVFSNDVLTYGVERSLESSRTSNSKGIRFIIMGSDVQSLLSTNDLVDFESSLSRFGQQPMSILCCYDCKDTIIDAPNQNLFQILLKTHEHCLFQGVGLRANRLSYIETPTVKVEVK